MEYLKVANRIYLAYNCLVKNLLSQESPGKKIKLRETEVNKENFRPPFEAEVG
jgi:hypothetical protein